MKRWVFAALMIVGLALVSLGARFSWAGPDAAVAVVAQADAAPAALADAGPVGPATLPTLDNSDAFMKNAFDAVMSKNWTMVTALALIAFVWLLRKFGSKRLPFLATDRGGAMLVMVTSVLGALATALGAGRPVSGDVLRQAVTLGFLAAGGWTWVKKVMRPKAIPAPLPPLDDEPTATPTRPGKPPKAA